MLQFDEKKSRNVFFMQHAYVKRHNFLKNQPNVHADLLRSRQCFRCVYFFGVHCCANLKKMHTISTYFILLQ